MASKEGHPENGSEKKSPGTHSKKCEVCGQAYRPEFVEFIGGYLHVKDCNCKTEEDKQREEEERRVKEGKKQSEIIQLIRAAGKRFEGAELKDFQGSRIGKIAASYIDKLSEHKENGEGLLFYGSPGNGKTRCAIAIGKEVIRAGYKAKFKPIPFLLDEIRSSYNSKETDEENVIKPYKQVDFLLLDDLGAEKWTEWVEAKLYQIIDYRYRNCLPVIITSNLQGDEIKDTVGYRAFDRLLEICLFVENDLKSYREKQAEERIKKEGGGSDD